MMWSRPATSEVLALAALLAATLASDGAEGRPRRRRAPRYAVMAPPALSASTEDDIVTLRTPGPDAVLVRGGTFSMGSNEAEVAAALDLCRREPEPDRCSDDLFTNEYGPHSVFVDDVWIDRTEVTVAAFLGCVSAGRCREPPYASGGARFDRPELPVTLVTWHDAASYCAWAGGRLPTEAEWERAARGLGGRRYPWGNVYNPFLANHGRLASDELDGYDGFLELAPVDSFRDGRTPDGLADLAGNVEEWVADWYAPDYPSASSTNPKGPATGEDRVVRGGSYMLARPWLRATARIHDSPAVRRTFRGFRCARNAR